MAVRRRLEPRQAGRPEHPEDRAEPGAAAAPRTGSGAWTGSAPDCTCRAARSCRGRWRSCGRTVAAWRCCPCLLLLEIGLGALQPWPLKIVFDYVLWDAVPRRRRALDRRRRAAEPTRAARAGRRRRRRAAGRQSVRVGATARRCRSIPASGWSTTCGIASSSTCRRSACITTSRRTRATRSTASTSTPIRSRTS